MPNLLIAGLPLDMERCLVQRFEGRAGFVVRTARSGEETLVQLAQDDYALLILDDGLKQPPAEEVLARSRHEMGFRKMKTIYCLEPARLATLSRDFAKHLQSGDQMLFHPLRQEKLIQEVLWTLGPQPSLETQEAADEDELSELSEEVWSQFQGRIFEQVTTIEEAGCALLDGSLTSEQCEKAQREAHKLAGSLGSLGFEKGTQLAREIEQILLAGSAIGKAECLRVCDAVFELRELLEKGPSADTDQEQTHPQEPVAPPKGVREIPLLLVVDGDAEIGRSLAIEAPHFGVRVEAATTLQAARDLGSRETPSAVLLDPQLPEGLEEGLELAAELTARCTSAPIVVLTSTDSLEARLRYVDLGAKAFLEKPLPASQVLDAVVQLLRCEEKSTTRALVLDHDPSALASMAQSLENAGIAVRTFDDPLQLWRALQGPSPHILVIDADAPRLGGVELCRALRNDPRWNGTPILVSTARGNPEQAQRVFAAGADDLIVKPMSGPELVARLSARLNRTRRLVAWPERDSLSGLESSRSSLRVLNWLVRLSRRQREPLCLVALGLDNIERIGERPDRVVNQQYARLGQVLLSAFRSADIVSRWSDDEFLVALYGMTRSDGVQRIAEFLEAMRSEEFGTVSGAGFQASLSAGVAQFPHDGFDLGSLCRAASQARQEARKRGGDRVLPAGGSAGEPSREPDVVLVDDDETLTGLLRHTLETRGYRTESFTDGKAALEKLAGPRPHLQPRVLLLDVDLPGMDGLTVLRRLAEDGAVKKTRVIMLTARSSEAEIVSALESGAFDHVAKPFSLRVLVQRVRRAMEV